MAHQTLTFQRKDHVGVIHISCYPNNQEKAHLLSGDLVELCNEITWSREIWVIIFTGTGESFFCSETGLTGSISELTSNLGTKCWSLSDPIAKLDRPVIVAINGDAIGQGLELALACDIRIASETARFGLPQIKSGLMPWDGGAQRLARLVGKGKALEMILTGEVIDVQQALRIGLVNKIVSPDKLMAAAIDLAQEMASKGPIALRYAKEAIYKGMDMTLEQGLRLEADLYLLIHTSRDRTEGIQAFREKRTPKFEGK